MLGNQIKELNRGMDSALVSGRSQDASGSMPWRPQAEGELVRRRARTYIAALPVQRFWGSHLTPQGLAFSPERGNEALK